MANIDEKTKIPLYATISLVGVIIGLTVWLTSVAADASKGAKSAEKVTEMYYDIKAIKRQLNIKDEIVPREE